MPKHPDQEIEVRYREHMNALASVIDGALNGEARGRDRKTGFVLLVYPFGDVAEGRCNYLSNGANRADMAALFREMAARFEGQAEQEAGHA